MFLEAATDLVNRENSELHIIGDGPQRVALQAMTNQLRIGSRVIFHGGLNQTKVQERLRTFDFMVLPSIKEFGGGVVVEAMALGAMPIVADYGGHPSWLIKKQE